MGSANDAFQKSKRDTGTTKENGVTHFIITHLQEVAGVGAIILVAIAWIFTQE